MDDSEEYRTARLILGTAGVGARVPEEQFKRVFEQAYELGITEIDTAPVYSDGAAESALGRILAAHGGEVRVMTKAGFADPPVPGVASRLMASALRSIDRLQRDRIDVFQLHEWHAHWDVDEVAETLTSLVAHGWVEAIGLSRFDPRAIAGLCDALVRSGGPQPVGIQIPANILQPPSPTTVAAARFRNIEIWGVSPLAGGFLTDDPSAHLARSDRYRRLYSTNAAERGRRAISAVADAAGSSVTHIALRWLAGHRSVDAVIVGADTAGQVIDLTSATTRALESHTRADLDAIAGLRVMPNSANTPQG